MEEIYLKARAKVNLNLEVLEKRKDNYHNIQSVFQKINLYDELYIKKTKTGKIEIDTNINELQNEENIISKAYKVLKNRNEAITGVRVKLIKKIPMQAGLAGGSTDCASFILGMNKLFDLKLTKMEIEEIGKNLGADVPPCFYNKAVKAEGIGEIITPINTNFKYYFVIIKPKVSFSTKEMYQKIDSKKMTYTVERINNIKQALEQQKLELLVQNLYNTFEDVIPNKDIIQNIKNELIEQGAMRKYNDWFRLLCLWDISKQTNSKKSL
ncbi:MAG: 4-(cytidine 5'-diphospho)-2-C-methyl-D-erythritol kinase [Clostridia bacterium]|nr:4-(cytidine 5'-diphospho)-2-C-methyl-D-erythritol kinase [Clostridia bacterium]